MTAKLLIEKFSLGAAMGFGLTASVLAVSAVYATYASLTASTSELLTKDKWNEMLQYTVPPGAVMAFNLSACPTGWSIANGTGGTPDLRGEFIRGLDLGKGVDSGRTIGSFQADQIISHKHAGGGFNDGSKFRWGASGYSNLSNAIATYNGGTGGMEWGSDAHGINATSTNPANQIIGGNETRPRNVALLYCVKN